MPQGTAGGAGAGASTPIFDAVVIGAGFAGMYMLHRLREAGFSVRLFEAGSGVGGTWYWNRYPGARCDVESVEYSYSFDPDLEQEWTWTERYPSQPEILRYANHVADRFDLRSDMQFETRVTSAEFDEDASTWDLTTDTGGRVRTRFCITAMGCLSVPKDPEVVGSASFAGEVFHTGRWPHEGVDLQGKRVAVIGTGSSGIQAIPEIAKQASQLYVLQRTPAFTLPARNAPLLPEYIADIRSRYRQIRTDEVGSPSGWVLPWVGEGSALDASEDERLQRFEERWAEGGPGILLAYEDIRKDEDANRTAADFVRHKIAETVTDPEVARRLTPIDYPIGAKRVCLDTDYYATYNRENVTLIDIRSNPIAQIGESGIELQDGVLEVDCIVFASGFDAMTGALLKLNPRGRDGLTLSEKWEAGPRTYLGLAVAGFPNLLTITGPGSPSVLSNMLCSIEQHVDWITECLEYLRETGSATIEARLDDEDRWVDHVWELGQQTLYPKANSWYVGANVPGKPRVFMPYVGGLNAYRKRCRAVADKGYEGFEIRSASDERVVYQQLGEPAVVGTTA
jgi:cyclohexanone monooxygenase